MMCDVRLIYLGNNKFGKIKCKPEVLSPLPKPKPFREEENPRTLVSPSEELVVGILDESKSSCTNRTSKAGHELEAAGGI